MVALWVRINWQCCLSKLGVVNMDLLTPLLTPSVGIVPRQSRRRLKFKHHLVQALTTLDPSQCCVANPLRDHWTCRARFVSLHFIMVSLLVIIFVPLLGVGSNSTMKGPFIRIEASASPEQGSVSVDNASDQSTILTSWSIALEVEGLNMKPGCLSNLRVGFGASVEVFPRTLQC